MEILTIRPAVRGGSKAIIGIAGISGSGKTYTALLMARGMVDKPSEIGFLDTENKRGSLYADILDGQFLIGDLVPPFSPQRYSDGIKQFQDAGVKVLVIDSVSHEWEGEGGCDDIANAPLAAGKKMANWIGAKKAHKSFMNTLLQCNMHVICCIRAREKTDFKDPTKPVSLGIQPVCEKNFMFEMTASLLMENEGTRQTFLKVPSFLKKSFGTGNGYLGEDTGKQIIEWINAGEKEDPEITKWKSEMMMVCENGLDALLAEWGKLTAEMQEKMKPFMKVYKASAKAYDEQSKDSDANENESTERKLDLISEMLEDETIKISEDDRIIFNQIVDEKDAPRYDKAIALLIKSKSNDS